MLAGDAPLVVIAAETAGPDGLADFAAWAVGRYAAPARPDLTPVLTRGEFNSVHVGAQD